MKLSDEAVRAALEPPGGEWRSEAGLKDSAVLAVLLEREGADWLLFNRRRDDLPWHAGQICFPGGVREEEEDAVACALRETCEEVGIVASDLAVIGRLPDRVSIAGFKVAAFVARMRALRPYRPRVEEVAEIFEIPCGALLEPARWGFTETRHPLARFHKVPCFDYGERRVWGLTGIILRDVLDRLAAGGALPPR